MSIIKKRINQWHIYLIVVGVLMLSALSWCGFVKNFQGENIHLVTHLQYDDTVDKSEVCKKEISFAITFCNYFEEVCDVIDDMWAVYKQSAFSKIDTIATYFETKEIVSSQVIAGMNGWLFYRSIDDGDTIADYEGTNSITENEMLEIYNSAISVQTDMHNKGIEFAILVPPNKENVYYEYMPSTYIHSEKSKTDILVDFLYSRGVNIISPKKELLENHHKYQLYYTYDTHWNQLGAYIGVRDTLLLWGINMPQLSERNISSRELKEEYHYCGEDDLAQMIGMRFVFSDEKEYTVDGTQRIDWNLYESEQNTAKVSYFYNDKSVNTAKVLVIGDSFRSSTIPFLGECFSDVYVVYKSFFTSDMLDEIKPDYVIVEYVERYSNEIRNINKLFEE